MIVCITEKPSVAKDIAAILGATTRRDGFFEGNGYKITWTFGHLCSLKEPQDYTDRWKAWSLGALPMIPPKFGIKLIADKGIEKQFKVIKTLFEEADEIVNCGDAGQEGELIQRWVMQKADCKKPVKRLWISSLTDESIRKGFSELRPQSDFDSLYFAGLSRAIGDWVLGINATRLFTLKYAQNRNILSVGRVQTPTLALIVARQKEIDNFKAEDYWELKTVYRDVVFNLAKGRFESEEKAQQALNEISTLPFSIVDCKTKRGKESAPRLFDLTSLQVECNKKYGFSADETLRLIQSLYEKKFTTYPRVDTTYLSDDMYPKIPAILEALRPYASLTATLLDKKIPKSKKIFDNAKVTDHHAIIPTNVPPASYLSIEEKKVYDMVARRFIAAFYPDCEFDQTTVMGKSGNCEFKAVGKLIVAEGWREVYKSNKTQQNEKNDESEADDCILPDFKEGESGPHSPSVVKKTTQPPKPYTEGTLLRAMETAGRFVDDENLREALKENGIGRPSTRAAIIETLFKRKYIQKERKSLKATAAGIALIDTIKIDLLKSAKLTGIWENKLRKIERKEYEAAQFINELKELIGQIVIDVLSDNSGYKITTETSPATADKTAPKKKKTSIKDIAQIPCPICYKGHIIKGKTAYGCSNYNTGCTFRLPFAEASDSLTPTRLYKLIQKKYPNQNAKQ